MLSMGANQEDTAAKVLVKHPIAPTSSACTLVATVAGTSMQSRRFHPVIAWLCLIWFGLTNTVIAGGVVVCRDGHGGMSIEWGCDRNSQGECLTACGDEADNDDSTAPHPCEDTPVPSNLQIIKAPLRAPSELTVPITVLVAAPIVWTDAPRPAAISWVRSRQERPPDVLKHVRTVVLLV